MGGHSGAECERLRRERQPLLAQVATLTHRAEVAERSCEDAKRREQEASAKMQAMAQSESNKALRHRAEAAERELSEVHRGVESVRLHNARVARDAANDAAALWRERCNKAEQKADVLTAELRRLYAAVCRGQTRSDDARAIAQAVIDEYVQTAEQCDRNDTLRADRDAARFLAAGWRRLARHYQSCHLAGHACLRETHRAKGEQVAALRRARDDDAAYRSDLMEQCDALRAKLARAEGVVEAAHHITRCHDMSCTGSPCTCGLDTLISALATYEEG